MELGALYHVARQCDLEERQLLSDLAGNERKIAAVRNATNLGGAGSYETIRGPPGIAGGPRRIPVSLV